MTREQELTKIIDELITLFCLREGRMDFNVIDRALAEIARTRQNDPTYPITLGLYDYMIEKGFKMD